MRQIVSTFAIYFANTDDVITRSAAGPDDQEALEAAFSFTYAEANELVETFRNGTGDPNITDSQIRQILVDHEDVDEAFFLLRAMPGVIVEEWSRVIE